MTTWRALMRSRCPACQDPILRGDEIVMEDDQWVHSECEGMRHAKAKSLFLEAVQTVAAYENTMTQQRVSNLDAIQEQGIEPGEFIWFLAKLMENIDHRHPDISKEGFASIVAQRFLTIGKNLEALQQAERELAQ